MNAIPTRALFRLGRIVATPNALENLSQAEILRALRRHQTGDWGDMSEADRQSNARALIDGSRLLSAYRAHGQMKFWVITEADRSVTTILMPEDY